MQVRKSEMLFQRHSVNIVNHFKMIVVFANTQTACFRLELNTSVQPGGNSPPGIPHSCEIIFNQF